MLLFGNNLFLQLDQQLLRSGGCRVRIVRRPWRRHHRTDDVPKIAAPVWHIDGSSAVGLVVDLRCSAMLRLKPRRQLRRRLPGGSGGAAARGAGDLRGAGPAARPGVHGPAGRQERAAGFPGGTGDADQEHTAAQA